MQPKIPNWTTVTWLLGSLWLLLALWGNTPFFQPHPKNEPKYDLRGYWVDSRKTKQHAYEYTALIGWPINYMHVEQPLNRISKFSALALLANILCVLFAILSLAGLSERYLRRFSIRFLFILTAMFSVSIAAIPYIIPDWGIIVFINGMLALFVLPMCIQITIGAYLRCTRQFTKQYPT